MRNKKGMVFHVSLVLVTIMALTYAYIVLNSMHEKDATYTIGERQFGLFESYQAYHEQLQLFGQDMEPVVAEAIIELASQGGFFREKATEGGTHPCGSFRGYPLWNTRDRDIEACFPARYQRNFERHLAEISPVSLTIEAISTTQEATTMVLTSKRTLESRDRMREDPDYSYSKEPPEGAECDEAGICTPPLVDYEEANALQGPSCPARPQDPKTSRCFYLPESDFTQLYSINSPQAHHLNIAYPGGNAVQYDLARHLINISEQWYEQECARSDKKTCGYEQRSTDEECCRARIGISSLSTGDTHAATSHHHIGNAADIYACYDASGGKHTAEEYFIGNDEVFGRCYELIEDYFAENMGEGSTLISGEDCLGRSCEDLDEDDKRRLMSSHQDHIHMNPPDTVLT